MSKHFVNHHVHSHWSVKDATNKPLGMSRRIVELGQRGFFLTDHGVLTGFSEIQRAAKNAGIKAVPGVEFYVAIRGMTDRTGRDTAHLTVWAYNLEGYRNLCRLHTKSHMEGYYFDPRVDLDLLAEHSEGLMASSGCLGGMVPKALVAGDKVEAERRVKELSQIFDGRFWIEMQNHGIQEEADCRADLLAFAKKYKLPIIASTDSHYTENKDWIAHDALTCLRVGGKISDTNRKIMYVPEQFALQSEDDMLDKHDAAHVYESGRVLDMCDDIDISSKVFHLPQYSPWNSPDDELKALVKQGLKDRYGISRPTKETGTIGARAHYELEAICKAGFDNYLLIVWDLYAFARREGIPCGAGRGSAAGSVVCYCIGITNIDPMKYDLMFERFIDPNRVSQPDIDADFSAIHRPRIIEYIKERWGHDKVAQIVAYQTLGGRAAPRDMARVLGYSIDLGDKIAKLIPQEGSVTRDREERHYIADGLDTVKELKALYDSNTEAREIIDLAIELEGTIKTPSLHAAGIVIADDNLGEYCPMISVDDKDGKGRVMATGYEMNELENIGLIKIDVLGIKYLDVLYRAFELAREDGVINNDFTPDDIDVDDESIYRLLSAGKTAGIFQAEGPGMTKLMRDLKPDCYDDIATCISIFRPGPISQIGSLVARKNGTEEIQYPHPSLEPILKATYGLTIYQESIIKIGQVIAGFSLTRADQLRKVIAKKIVEKMPAEKAEFIESAVKNGHDKKWATKLFTDLIEPAAKYAFGRSHAYSYADLTAKTAWIKANLTKYFYAALLTNTEDHAEKADKMRQYIADARDMGVAILPPNINTSGLTFTPSSSDNSVAFGLNGIKFVGNKAVQEIIKEREKHGPFTDLFSFVSRVKTTLVNSRCIESLVGCGALDCLPGNRESKLATLETALTIADAEAEDRKRERTGLKPIKRRKAVPEKIMSERPPSPKAMLDLELDLIGTYLSGHPYDAMKGKSHATHTIQEARENGGDVSVCGIVTQMTEHTTKKSKAMMYFGVIEDDRANLTFTIFPRQAKEIGKLTLGSAVVLSGSIEGDEVETKLLVSSAKELHEAAQATTDDYIVRLTEDNYHEQIKEAKKKHEAGWITVKFILPDERIVSIAPNS